MTFRSNSPLLLVVVLTAACSANTLASSEPVVLTIEGHDIRYEPGTIEVTAGQPVELIFENVGALDHDISFAQLPTAEEPQTASHEGDSHEDNHEGEHEHNDTANHEADGEHNDHNQATETTDNHTHHEAALHVHTSGGEKATVTFTPTEPGTYEFYCTVPGHREAGMIGRLIVTVP